MAYKMLIVTDEQAELLRLLIAGQFDMKYDLLQIVKEKQLDEPSYVASNVAHNVMLQLHYGKQWHAAAIMLESLTGGDSAKALGITSDLGDQYSDFCADLGDEALQVAGEWLADNTQEG